MAVRIRLKRIGAKNTPAYRIVVTDSRSPRDGRFIEEIGSYMPTKPENKYKINLERANYWVGVGALPSETVASMIKKATKAAQPAA
jgi:small subunit ribosomal protein S16